MHIHAFVSVASQMSGQDVSESRNVLFIMIQARHHSEASTTGLGKACLEFVGDFIDGFQTIGGEAWGCNHEALLVLCALSNEICGIGL